MDKLGGPWWTASSYHLMLVITSRKSCHQEQGALLLLPNGVRLTQNPALPWLLGQVGLRSNHPVDIEDFTSVAQEKETCLAPWKWIFWPCGLFTFTFQTPLETPLTMGTLDCWNFTHIKDLHESRSWTGTCRYQWENPQVFDLPDPGTCEHRYSQVTGQGLDEILQYLWPVSLSLFAK